MRSLLSLTLFALSLFAGATVADSHVPRRHHDSLARRARGDLQQRGFDSARFTFYDVGLGACGKYNGPSDFIVALNSAQFGSGYPGPNCFKSITMSYNGKTTQAVIMDECPGCPYGGLDLSTGLFQYFADESVGVLYGSWFFSDAGGGSGGGDTTTSKWESSSSSQWQPPTTTTPKWTPTTTSEEKPSSTPKLDLPSSIWSPVSSSSSTHTSKPPSTPLVSSIDFSSGPASGLAVPTGVVGDNNDPQNILSINQAIVGIGALILAGHRL